MAIYADITTFGGSLVGTRTYGQKSISIYDAATNLPTNGNNCLVKYQMNINGTVSTLTIPILGISAPIYTGELSDTSSSTPFFTSFTILSVTPATSGGTTVIPAADDLALSSIVTTPESAIGANDGTVKIVATSSFPAITYSLDGVTYQSSPIFTGQPGGVGTGYAKDVNGGLVSGPYTVGFIGNVLISDPSVDLGNGHLSRWNAAFNPIIFTFQREDFEITSLISGNFSKIKVAVNADLTLVTARSTTAGVASTGDLVYIKTANYSGTFEVLEKAGSSLTLDCPFVANDTLGFININAIKAYYQIQMKISYVDAVTGKTATVLASFTPLSDGSLKADISNFLQSLVVARDSSAYSLINYRDMQLSASYQISYAEVWNNGIVSWIDIARPYYVIFAAKQLGDVGGGNLQQYVPYLLGFQPAKWLTDFKMPVYSNGFPFDLPFIFSEYMVGLAPFYTVTLLDINKAPLTIQSVDTTFLLTESGGFILQEDGSKFIIANQSVFTGPVVEHVGLNRLLVNFNLPDICYYFTVKLQYTAGGTTYDLMQPLMVRVAKETPDRPVYLRWIGLSGSWQYYKFVYNQMVTLDVADVVAVKRFVFDWQNEDTIEDVISKNAGEKMQVFGENVSVDDIKGLQSIKYSPKVQMMTSAGTPPKWQTVVVASGSFNERETMLDAYSFSLVFALPGKNVQNQ